MRLTPLFPTLLAPVPFRDYLPLTKTTIFYRVGHSKMDFKNWRIL
jgi:hypothetical protein